MKLSVFTEYQRNSDNPFMCINPEHEMTLVPFITDDLIIELRCFFPKCDYKMIPGLNRYKEIIDAKIKS